MQSWGETALVVICSHLVLRGDELEIRMVEASEVGVEVAQSQGEDRDCIVFMCEGERGKGGE